MLPPLWGLVVRSQEPGPPTLYDFKRLSTHFPQSGSKSSFWTSLICTGARRNPMTFGTSKGSPKKTICLLFYVLALALAVCNEQAFESIQRVTSHLCAESGDANALRLQALLDSLPLPPPLSPIRRRRASGQFSLLLSWNTVRQSRSKSGLGLGHFWVKVIKLFLIYLLTTPPPFLSRRYVIGLQVSHFSP